MTSRVEIFSEKSNSWNKQLEVNDTEGMSLEMSRRAKINSHKPADTTKTTRKRKMCSAGDCLNQAVQGGVCVRHGAKRKQCSVDDCQKYAQVWSLRSARSQAQAVLC